MITKEEILAWLHRYREVIGENKEFLTELDSAIGDADHGINMDRGFDAVEKKLDGVADKDIGTILKTVGMTLVTTVGGAGGPLYGTFFLKAGMALAGKEELTDEDMVAAMQAAVDGVKMRPLRKSPKSEYSCRTGRVTLRLYVRQCVQVWRNGCIRYPLTQHWLNP